jgi:hypothetical protein
MHMPLLERTGNYQQEWEAMRSRNKVYCMDAKGSSEISVLASRGGTGCTFGGTGRRPPCLVDERRSRTAPATGGGSRAG